MAEYTVRYELVLKAEEKEMIQKKMKAAGIRNMAAYMRKMAIDGYILRLDLSDLKEVTRLLRINANNLNQYAKKANETGSIYLVDIQNLQRQYDEIWPLLRQMYERLNEL